MDLHDRRNIERVKRWIAKKWNLPLWRVSLIIQGAIDHSWEIAMLDPEKKALWDKYFPDGKPTSDEYILWLGHAYERGETMPYLFED